MEDNILLKYTTLWNQLLGILMDLTFITLLLFLLYANSFLSANNDLDAS